jgi:hypothetical protein
MGCGYSAEEGEVAAEDGEKGLDDHACNAVVGPPTVDSAKHSVEECGPWSDGKDDELFKHINLISCSA